MKPVASAQATKKRKAYSSVDAKEQTETAAPAESNKKMKTTVTKTEAAPPAQRVPTSTVQAPAQENKKMPVKIAPIAKLGKYMLSTLSSVLASRHNSDCLSICACLLIPCLSLSPRQRYTLTTH